MERNGGWGFSIRIILQTDRELSVKGVKKKNLHFR